MPAHASASPLHLVPSVPLDHRVDAWNGAVTRLIDAHFHIQADAEPDVLCRLLGFFAQQQLTPSDVSAHREDDDRFALTIRHPSLCARRAEVIAQKMRSLVSVFAVELREATALAPRIEAQA